MASLVAPLITSIVVGAPILALAAPLSYYSPLGSRDDTNALSQTNNQNHTMSEAERSAGLYRNPIVIGLLVFTVAVAAFALILLIYRWINAVREQTVTRGAGGP
ncbi:hypothetical protein F4808DRAFT_454696 [Astrocystis sublimbata]|nr:hypothetical protein F4808DRAFT_454696 [Astrocystis sublimbata]